jgi:glycerol-3-phosphate O-acyltransferase/dihydroxyacetone phosphate acyltransferase
MLYYIIRPIVRFALKIFFRKISLSNLDNIPEGKPVILAANHPTAFLEPCILACFQRRGLFYLVRGDIFANPFYAKILASLHMLPVYRKRDRGFKFIKENYSTFSTCHQTLAKNRTVMILAEGTTEHEKRLRPLMKGTARIAFGTLAEFPATEDVYIVPVGVNYTYADRFRSEVYIDFGEPISTRSFESTYTENPNQGINDLTNTLRKKLEPRVIHVESESDDELVEKLFRFDRSRQKFRILPIVNEDNAPLKREKEIADFVNGIKETSKQKLTQVVDSYFSILEECGLGACTRFEKHGKPLLLVPFFILGFPFFLAGYLFGYPPMWFAKFMTNKRVKDVTFFGSVLMAIGVVGWLIYLLLLIIIVLITKIYFLLLLPLLAFFALFYGDMYASWLCRWRYRMLSEEKKEKLSIARGELENMLF